MPFLSLKSSGDDAALSLAIFGDRFPEVECAKLQMAVLSTWVEQVRVLDEEVAINKLRCAVPESASCTTGTVSADLSPAASASPRDSRSARGFLVSIL